MPYNISVWNQFECSLRIPMQSINNLFTAMSNDFNENRYEGERRPDGYDYVYRRPIVDGATVRMYLAGEWEEALVGKLEGDMVIIEKINICSDWSGTCFEYMIEHLFRDTSGVYRAVLIWEEGQSITLFEIVDGCVSSTETSVQKLVAENQQMKKMLEEKS